MKASPRTVRSGSLRRPPARRRAPRAWLLALLSIPILLPALAPLATAFAEGATTQADAESTTTTAAVPKAAAAPAEPRSGLPPTTPLKAGPPTVYRVPIEGMVDLGMAAFVARVVAEATADPNGVILLDINTFGGRVDAAVLIRDSLINAEVPTYAFINPRAISAGALISLACERIGMRAGGTIGAATPITMGEGDEEPDAADEKMMSYMRTEMRATAERRGRPGTVAEAMVDPDVGIEGLIEAGKVLTLTTQDALRVAIVEFEAESLAAVLEEIGLSGAKVEDREMNWAEMIARAVSNPVLSSFLLSIGFLGIIIELYHPGWGLPGTVGILSLIVFFFGHHVVRLAGGEEILLFFIGVLLLAIEVLVIPGFGFVGFLGITLMMIATILSLVALDLKISWELGYVADAMGLLTSVLLLTMAAATGLIYLMPKTRAARRFVLNRTLAADTGFTSHAAATEEGAPIGSAAEVLNDLRPAGKIRLPNGQRLDAVSEGGFIAAGTHVSIVAWRSGSPVVRAVQAPSTALTGEQA